MGWRVFAASAIGKSHIDAGTPCQDASAHDVEGDTVLAVVCDGAGSQPLSHIGAQAMSRMVVQALKQRVADELKTTFASRYGRQISLAEALQPDNIARYSQRATGTKVLINPNKDAVA